MNGESRRFCLGAALGRGGDPAHTKLRSKNASLSEFKSDRRHGIGQSPR